MVAVKMLYVEDVVGPITRPERRAEMPSWMNPPSNEQALELTVTAVRGQMKFSVENFTVKPSQRVKITFTNPDEMQHNLVVVRPDMAKYKRVSTTVLSRSMRQPLPSWRESQMQTSGFLSYLPPNHAATRPPRVSMTPSMYASACAASRPQAVRTAMWTARSQASRRSVRRSARTSTSSDCGRSIVSDRCADWGTR